MPQRARAGSTPARGVPRVPQRVAQFVAHRLLVQRKGRVLRTSPANAVPLANRPGSCVPAKRTSPEAGRVSPVSARKRVVLPLRSGAGQGDDFAPPAATVRHPAGQRVHRTRRSPVHPDELVTGRPVLRRPDSQAPPGECAARLVHRQRQGFEPKPPAKFADRRHRGQRRCSLARAHRPGHTAIDPNDAIHSPQQPLQPVFGQQDR